MNIIKDGLTFDDVLLVPQHSEIDSRSKIDVSVNLGEFKFSNPIIPANMKTVCDVKMAEFIAFNGGLAILHRFMPIEEQYEACNHLINLFGLPYKKNGNAFGVSVGVKGEDKEAVLNFLNLGVKIVCIDIAHGDSAQCIDMIKYIKRVAPSMLIIAGNVATGEAATRLWKAGANVVKVGVGPGCFAAGTRILMSNGTYKNIEEVSIGDYVINMNGKPVKVLNAFSTGNRKVSKLRNNIFYEDTYVTSDHNFWVGDLNSSSKESLESKGYRKLLDLQSKTLPKKSKYKWKKIGDVHQDVLLMPKIIDFKLPETFEISLNKRAGGNYKSGHVYEKDSVITPSYDSGYLFGTFIGDGHAMCAVHKGSNIGSVMWYFGKEEKEIANKLVNSIKKIFNKEAQIKETDNTTNVVFYYKPLADFLSSFGKKTEKHLPQNFIVNNKEYLQGIYDGLIDSDGHLSDDGRLGFTNTSVKAIELFNILNYLVAGSFPNSEKKKITAGGLKDCNIENCNQPYSSRTIKRADYRQTQNYQVVKLLAYEDTNIEVPVYDLTVDCDTHSFIANNMIVHNSLCTTRVETGNGVPQLTALMDVAEARSNMMRDDKNMGYRYQIIADGGIKSAGDIVKALCFADMVMVGNLFAGCDEAPGNILNVNGRTYKEYVGSSTHKTNHIEGIAAMVPYKGPVSGVLTKLIEGLQSGCSYQGCSRLAELRDNPQFIKISNSGLVESHPHDVTRI